MSTSNGTKLDLTQPLEVVDADGNAVPVSEAGVDVTAGHLGRIVFNRDGTAFPRLLTLRNVPPPPGKDLAGEREEADAEGHVSTPHSPVAGVTLWNSDDVGAKRPLYDAAVKVDGEWAGWCGSADPADFEISEKYLPTSESRLNVPRQARHPATDLAALRALRDRVRAERAARTPQQGEATTPPDYGKAKTPGGREVTFWNYRGASADPSCWAVVGNRILFIDDDGNVSDDTSDWCGVGELEDTKALNAWPLPDGTLARIDAYLDQREGEKEAEIVKQASAAAIEGFSKWLQPAKKFVNGDRFVRVDSRLYATDVAEFVGCWPGDAEVLR